MDVTLISSILVLTGAGLLAASLLPVFRFTKLLTQSGMRFCWQVLTIFILFFFSGYIAYFLLVYSNPVKADILVSSIFFFASLFILLVNLTAWKTTSDVCRVIVLEEESIMDPLLGIYNRRFMERQLDLEIERARRYDFPLSVLMIDIDHFKRINDTLGHQVGDAVLWDLSALLVSGVRNVDTVARYGGEELVIVAPHTAGCDAATMAEHLRQAVEEAEFTSLQEHTGRGELKNLTISIGVASLDDSVSNAHDLLELADKALYRAKREGRNRVVLDESAAKPATYSPVTSSTWALASD